MSLLAQSPLLLLFAIAAIGSLVGSLRIGRFQLGVAAVLFVGLAFNAIDPKLVLPDTFQQLGLVLFVYAIGLSSGPGFFASFGSRGLRDSGVTLLAIGAGAAVAVVAELVGHLRATHAVGLFAGALTNTPALAAVLQQLEGKDAAAEPVVGYSVAYPFGVVGLLVAMHLAHRRAAREEASPSRPAAGESEGVVTRTVRIARADAIGKPIDALREHEGWNVAFGRHRRGTETSVVTDLTVLAAGDLLTVVGPPGEVHRVTGALGEEIDLALELDRTVLDVRRVFVSSRDAAGRCVADVNGDLLRKFGAHLTRIRRGDVDLVATDDATLEPGDRVRVVAPRERMAAVTQWLGDSYRAVGEIDVVTVGVGIALGIVLGAIVVPLPGNVTLSLGIAGGPLVAGLVLGRLGRTGSVVWTMPYGANLTLRQLGLVLFFAGVGTRAGAAFVRTVASREGLILLAAGALVTIASASTMLVVGKRLLRVPIATLLGMVAGAHTQPAALAFATEQTGSEQASHGYVAAFPIATIAKIVVAQVLFAVFSR